MASKNKIQKILVSILIFIVSAITIGLILDYVEYLNETKETRQKVAQINSEDRKILTEFFQNFLNTAPGAYTLYGDKAISFDAFNPKNPDIKFLDRGWQVWQKHKDLFPSTRFSLISYPSITMLEFTEIDLINHEAFIKIVNQYKQDFDAVLGKELEPQIILQEYLKAEGDIFKAIRLHDGLFGTLLGYGRNNAWAYKNNKRKEMIGFNNQILTFNFIPLLPMFLAIPSEETNRLHKKYIQQRHSIIKKNFIGDPLVNALHELQRQSYSLLNH